MANAPKTKKENEVTPTGTAKVIERRGPNDEVLGKTVNYEAEIQQKDVPDTDTETEIEFDDFSNETYGAEFEQEIPAIPDTPLEILFKQLRGAISNGIADNFLAMVSRSPDPIGMRFNRPNSLPSMSLGAFSFSSRDLFNFDSAIQEKNGNSGGIFNIKVYKGNNEPLMLRRNPYDYESRGNPQYYEVGLVNYSVPDPAKTDATPGTSQDQSALLEYMKQSENRFESLLQAMNKPREKTTLEAAIEQKVLNDILNPPQNNNNSPDAFQQTMLTMLAMPQMVEKFSSKMFPDPPAPVEPDMMDRITKLLDVPAVANVIENLSDVSSRFAISKMNGQAQAVELESEFEDDEPDYQESQNDIEMKDLIHNLIIELESDNPITATSPFIINLQRAYPGAASTVVSMCKSVDFETTIKLLGRAMDKMSPNPMIDFVDVAKSQEAGQYVWNPRGEKLKVRLNEFYTFAKTL